MANYYLVPIAVNIAFGTALFYTVSRALSLKRATLLNAFLFVVGTLSFIFLRNYLFAEEFLFSWVLVLVAYFFWIRYLYNLPYDKVAFFLFVSIIVRISAVYTVGAFFSEAANWIL